MSKKVYFSNPNSAADFANRTGGELHTETGDKLSVSVGGNSSRSSDSKYTGWTDPNDGPDADWADQESDY